MASTMEDVERSLWKMILECYNMLCVLNRGMLSLLMHTHVLLTVCMDKMFADFTN